MKKFKIGQHIRLKSLPNSYIEITGINNAGYIYIGDAVVNGSIIGKEQKVIPFEYEDDYEVIDCGEKKSMKNEKKALQLAGLKETPDEEERYYNPFNCMIYDKCLEMASWKEQQMIEKFREFLKNYENSVIITDADLVIEDFKKTMEE